ncbi:MAG: hypothetical protein JO000_00900 [Alphaproteobacteria bacterium]|nr:hypothetical protein [Alphaproteobacteria bacterium]
MTAQVSALPGLCRQLRVLEDAVAAQRRIIASLDTAGLDSAAPRQCLAQLLAQLDCVLAHGEIEPHVGA